MIVFNFDVLAEPGPDIVRRSPRQDGMRLWKMLYEATLGRMAVVMNDDVDPKIVEHWMKMYDVRPAWFDVLATNDPVIKVEKVELVMNSFGRNDWYIDTDPATCSQALTRGITTLMVATPYVVRPEWVEDPSPTAWTDLVKTVQEQLVAKTERRWERGEG